MSQSDLAVLGLEVRSDGVVVASQRLDGLNRSAESTARATDRFKNELAQTNQTAQATAKTIDGVTKALSVMGAAMSAAFAFKTLSDFEQSMSSVRAVTRATGSELELLRDKAKELGATTRYTASDAAEAMRMLAQAGFKANEVLVATGDVLALAQAGSMGLADAAEISAKALRGFRLDVEQMGDVADLMTKAFTSSNTTVRELGEAFTYVGPVATSFGISIQDTTAAIAALSDAGISSSMAGTSLRGMLTKLANPTRQAQQLLKEAGLSMDQLDVKTRGLIPVLEDLANSTIGVEEAMVIFGQRAGPGFEVLASSIEKMRQFSKEFRDIEGYAKDTAAIMDDNLKGALLNFVSAMEDMIINAAESSGILTGLKEGLILLSDVLAAITKNAITPWLDNAVVALGLYIAATKGAALYTSATSGAIAYQITLFKMYVASTAGAATATNMLTAAFAGLRAVLLTLATNPLFWVVAAGSALYMLYDTVKQSEKEMENLRQAFRSTGEQAEYVTQQAKDAAAALKEMQDQTRLTDAQNALKGATSTLDGVLERLERSTGMATSARSATASYERQIGSLGEAFTGFEQGTIAAGKAVRGMYAELKKTDDVAKQAEIVASAMRTLRELEKANPKLESIQIAIKDVEALGGALKLVVDAMEEVEKASGGVKKVGDAAKESRREIEELEALLELIHKKPVVPQTAAEAVEFLSKLVEGTDSYKQKQYEASMETARASLAILAQAQALAIAEGRIQDAVDILAKYVELQGMLSQVKPPKASGGDRGAENAARFQEAAASKLVELNIKLKQTQVEVTGASKEELEVYKLKIEAEKELSDLRDKAAKAGKLGGSAEIAEAQRLVEEIYKLKIGVAEYNAEWAKTLKPLQNAVDVAQAFGAGVEDATRALKEQQRLQIQQNPYLEREEKARQLAVIEAEILTIQREANIAMLEASAAVAERTGHFMESKQYESEILELQIQQLSVARDQAKYDESRRKLEAEIALLKEQQREASAYAKQDWLELLNIGIEAKAVESQRAFLDIWKEDIPNAVGDVSNAFGDLTIDLIASSKSATESWEDFGSALSNIFDQLARQIMYATLQAILFGQALNSSGGGSSGGGLFGWLGKGITMIAGGLMGGGAGAATSLAANPGYGGPGMDPALGEYVSRVPLHHIGGRVGNASQHRYAPSSLWADAQRFHNGGQIGNDEEAIIAKKGEWVLTPEQMAAYKGDATITNNNSTTNNWNIKVEGGSSGDAVQDEEFARRVGEQIQKQVENAAKKQILEQMRPGGYLNNSLGQ